MTYAITLHGVLQQHNGAPNRQGIDLYQALAGIGRVVVLGGPEQAKDEYFLASNGLGLHVSYVPEDWSHSNDQGAIRIKQVNDIRAAGTPIDLVVEPDPQIAARIFDVSVPVLLYLHPRFSEPSFRPDFKSVAKPWDEMVKVVDYQIQMKAKQVLPSLEESEEDE